MTDAAFSPDPGDLTRALEQLLAPSGFGAFDLPENLPEIGVGESAALDQLAASVLAGARALGDPRAFAHMDPPTPWVSWVTTLWNAALNQNLLHPDTAPVARGIETQVISWLAPVFGMNGGHMCPGSTVANLTAIWAAREVRSVTRVIASDQAHLSVAKAAHLLGLTFEACRTRADGALDPAALPSDLTNACVVLTAGTTSTGAIDSLDLCGRAAWTHVDAAWAGPLCLTDTYGHRLAGIGGADSIAVSAHKWLFQPKESALVLFKDTAVAHPAISFGGAYLAAPNIGVLGSHGAMAVPLLATLMAWGRSGMATRIERCMAVAEDLYTRLDNHPKIETFGPPVTGVLLWRPTDSARVDAIVKRLPDSLASQTRIADQVWFRQVAANPMADIELIWPAILAAIDAPA